MTTPIDPRKWYKAIPGWAGGRGRLMAWTVRENGASLTLYGMKAGTPPYDAFISPDPDERELARVVLTHSVQQKYRARFGSLTRPIPGAPPLVEYFKQHVKATYGENGVAVMSGE